MKNMQTILVELGKTLKPNDLDLICLYFENKKQSDGGDISKSTLSADARSIRIEFESEQTAERVFSKRFFSFKDYHLIATLNGYKHNENYAINKRQFLISNILLEKEKFTEEVANEVIRMYVEYLLPDNNDLVRLEQSQLDENTFLIECKEQIDKELLMQRFNKKSTLRSRSIRLIDSFQTNTFLLKPKQQMSVDVLVNLLKEYLNEDIGKQMKYFLEQFDDHLFVQIESEEFVADFQRSMDSFLDIHQLIMEYCHNFSLFPKEIIREKPTSTDHLSVITKVSEYTDQSIQTDFSMLHSVNSFNANRQQKETRVIDLNYTLIPLNSKCILKEDAENIILLGEPIYSAFQGSYKLWEHFRIYCKQYENSLEIRLSKDEPKAVVLEKKGQDTISNLRQFVEKFIENELSYQKAKIPETITKEKNKFSEFRSSLEKMNKKQTPAFCFLNESNELELIGTNKAVNDLKRYISSSIFQTV